MASLQSSVKLSGFSSAVRGTAVRPKAAGSRAAAGTAVQAATQVVTKKMKAAAAARPAPKTGTQRIGTEFRAPSGNKNVQVIQIFSKEKLIRPKVVNARPTPRILARVQELRLLSKLEKAGLLSLLEKNGLTLSAIEQSGLLSLAEKFGLVSAAADRNTPSALFSLATALLVAGPALVYLTPDDSTALIAAQAIGAAVCVAGGSAAWGGASLLSTLQGSK